MDTCRSCGAPIIWAHTQSEKRIPLDAEPDPGGMITLTEDKWGRKRADFLKLTPLFPPPPADERYTSHFATCREATKWRRRQ
jgi:hypothetical protein